MAGGTDLKTKAWRLCIALVIQIPAVTALEEVGDGCAKVYYVVLTV